ncbi:MAG: DUF11 domain-containing protein [Gemmatimonadetes bacterium]|nr:DUF11 domain-containing protein [Gemmatimonadota bacterium]
MNPRRSTRAAALAAAILALSALDAQAQTAEGTVIRNKATASFTDANSNAYANVADSVDVTVSFAAGLDAIAAAATVTPASPSSNDTLTFRVANVGNGTDSITIGQTIGDPTVVSVGGYRYGGTTYGSLVALNAALAGVALAPGDTAVIRVVYDVASGKGGTSSTYTLTATSRRTGGVSDAAVTAVNPVTAYDVAVTPDGGQNVLRLPSNGVNYTFQFSVENRGASTESFDLLASSPGSAVITIVSVNGAAGDSTRVSVANGATASINVVYSVAGVAAGSTDTIQFRARSVTSPTTLDDGTMDLTVVRPSLTITKQAYRDDQTTLIGAGTVAPGEYIQYKITVTNTGTAAAANVHVDDQLPATVTYSSSAGDAPGWTLSESAGDVDADLTGTLAAAGRRYFWIRVRIN